ncbi:hypothetical protein Purlil1_7909 [Purpureocillium lilacinum]|uniref:Uncharacterized protein n=1 Tax=Purpureocillium lilacinum TaxID=33203 RepID=A0ABR0BVG8_PURLI|nr:hypothetical protein Purlil1_7909 [Purpureocillium lilacinum]
MRVSLSTCLCLLSATASATLPPLGNKDILYPTLQSAREAATLVNEAQPLVGVSSPYPYPPNNGPGFTPFSLPSLSPLPRDVTAGGRATKPSAISQSKQQPRGAEVALCHIDLYVPRWGVGRGYILFKRATRYRCSPDSVCNELGQTCMHRWDPDMTICDYVHVIAEQAEPGGIRSQQRAANNAYEFIFIETLPHPALYEDIDGVLETPFSPSFPLLVSLYIALKPTCIKSSSPHVGQYRVE